jgi:vitamin B12 transporter
MTYRADTVNINEVVITGIRINSDLAGYKKSELDSSVVNNYRQATLDQVLSENTKIFIKSYGMGGIATPSFRGTSAGHTVVDWNGIDISSPMLGQTDLSLIPAGFIDNIQILFGGASMSMNSGGIGGLINLETKPVWRNESMIFLTSGIGSFGRYNGLAKIRTGNTRFQSVSKAFYQYSENDFRYLNKYYSIHPFIETRTNSQVQQKGFIEELYFKTSKSTISAKLWYQSANRNLPGSILNQPVNTGEKQFDESLRTMLTYDLLIGRTNYFLTAAMLFNRLNYTNHQASIDSRNFSGKTVVKAGIESRIGENFKLRAVINDEVSVIKTNNYTHSESRNTTSLTISASNTGYERIETSLLVREICDNNTLLLPDFSVGIRFRIFEDSEHFIKGNVSRNSKIPTMNDMFWTPGGNPDLRNEHALMYELTYEMKPEFAGPLTFAYDFSVFRNDIKDMIQWHVGENTYWTADNIQNVITAGFESGASLKYTGDILKSSLNAGYSFTRAVERVASAKNNLIDGKQLIYVPENQANVSIMLIYKSFYSSFITNFTGKRYTESDNSKFLNGYVTNSVSTGLKIGRKHSSADLNLSIENLLNMDYQLMAYYPLPGRTYLLKLAVQIAK